MMFKVTDGVPKACRSDVSQSSLTSFTLVSEGATVYITDT